MAGYDVSGVLRIALAVLAVATSTAALAQQLLVSAAASLTNAFTEVGRKFETRHAGTKVVFNFASSDVLLSQIAKGAPADVFASADAFAMNRGDKGGLFVAGSSKDFASNVLVVVVPQSSKLSIKSVSDLSSASVKRIAIGTPQTVPAGRYAKEALEGAGAWAAVEPKLVFTQNVRQALDYVAREEVDAGFVYATDAAVMPDRVKVVFDAPSKTPVRYPIAVVKDSGNAKLAQAFVAFVDGEEGRKTLARHGFRAP